MLQGPVLLVLVRALVPVLPEPVPVPPLWGPAPLWAGIPLCEAEALGEADEAVDPDWGCVPCGEQAAMPRTRADREVTARMRRVLIMAPSYEVPRRSRTATPGRAQG